MTGTSQFCFKKLFTFLVSLDIWKVLECFSWLYSHISVLTFEVDSKNRKIKIAKTSFGKRIFLIISFFHEFFAPSIYGYVLLTNLFSYKTKQNLSQVLFSFLLFCIECCVFIPIWIFSFKTSIFPNIINTLSSFQEEFLGKTNIK